MLKRASTRAALKRPAASESGGALKRPSAAVHAFEGKTWPLGMATC